MAGRNPAPAKRGKITGWSPAAVRRHTKWLYSVDAPLLDGVGIALTLTMRDTPASADDFQALRRALMKRWERAGAIRTHWVVEWQKRGTPHLHCAVYFPAETDLDTAAATLIMSWLTLASPYGASIRSQHYAGISGPLGWLQYLSKHASRGVRHYQRSGKPAGWEKTGRLWGHAGGWPTDEPMRFDMPMPAYHRYRRLVRSWRVANARAAGDPSRIRYARRMLMCPDPKLSAVRGVSDWLPEDVSLTLVGLLEREGFDITQRAE